MLLSEPITLQRNFVLLTIVFSVCVHDFDRYFCVQPMQGYFTFLRDGSKTESCLLQDTSNKCVYLLRICYTADIIVYYIFFFKAF